MPDALGWLIRCTTRHGGATRIRLGSWDGVDQLVWARTHEQTVERVRMLAADNPLEEILISLPQRKVERPPAGVHDVSVLWSRIEGNTQLKWAKWHRPLPTLILQEGTSTRRLLIWALSEPVGYFEAVNFNKRLAYRFGAKQNGSDPDELWIPVPGTQLRIGRKRPCPVRVSRMTPALFTAEMVAGRLREPPEPTWNKR